MVEPGRAYFDFCTEYNADKIAASLRTGLTTLGLEGAIKCGDRVLLKPNLIMAKAPRLAVTTHPEIVRAVAMVLKDCGARLYLGDSPGFGSLETVLEKCGFKPVLHEFAIIVTPFDQESVVVDTDNLVAKKLILATAASEFDKVVNLPKLKTHSMMGATLAIKNLFGFIPGLKKAAWHLRAGHDRDFFARIMFDIYRQVTPVWNFLDGIAGMEGDGPTGGTPRNFNLLALSADAPALDYLVEKWVGFPEPTPLSSVSLNLGLVSEESSCACGPAADKPLTRPIKQAQGTAAATFPGHKLWRRVFVKRPKVSRTRCQHCRVCVQHCPAQVMKLIDAKIVIDYKRCIRCYCCQELCPYGAIRVGFGIGS
ncbi:MAG: hypothetical protein DRH03_03945 [Deltaproteobacteria bacterium]|nr:MAG: hypothetical protein DRH03_03945 [Deltaproteobacteria bacterium]